MRAAQIQENHSILVTQANKPPVPPKGALVRVIGCGVCGSDLDKWVHQKAVPGSVLGHEVVGIIEALSDGHPEGWQIGDRLVSAHHVPCLQCHYCLNDSESMCRQFKNTNLNPGGFSEYISLTEGHLRHTAFKVPDAIGTLEASCVEPLACVLRAIRRSTLKAPGTVVIVGLGFIGLLAAQVYLNQGHQVFGLDLDSNRIALAKQQGFVTDAFQPIEDVEALTTALQERTPLGKADLVFLTAVNTPTLEQGLSLVRDGGQLVLFTSAANGTSIDPSRLYFREINLITSYSPGLVDLQQSAEMIFNQDIRVKPLISHQMPIDDIQKAFELYRSGQAMKVFIETGGAS